MRPVSCQFRLHPRCFLVQFALAGLIGPYGRGWPQGMATLLEIKNLHTSFVTSDGEFPAVDGLNLTIEAGKTLGLVGESGCGKSVTALSIMRLIRLLPEGWRRARSSTADRTCSS